MTKRTIVITGASDGIGAAAARALSERGEQVVVVGRSAEKTQRLADELNVASYVADFSVLAQVRELAAKLQSDLPRIDVLVNNAGAIMPKAERTVDGHERTLQVNHLASYLLTTLLVDRLAADNATVVTTASDEAFKGRIDLEHLDDVPESGFDAKQAYADSKLANVLFTRELQARHGSRGITAVAFHPGIIASNFVSDTTTSWRFVYNTPLRHVILSSPEKGIRPLVRLLADDPGTTWTPGEFYVKDKPAPAKGQTGDLELASRLWDTSAALVGAAA